VVSAEAAVGLENLTAVGEGGEVDMWGGAVELYGAGGTTGSSIEIMVVENASEWNCNLSPGVEFAL